MKLIRIFLIGAAALALAGCSNAAEDEAKRLGFSSASEMEEVQSKGWHSNAQYRADEGERAKRFGFTDIDELHRADQAGVKTKAQYDKYVADLDASNAEFAREEAAREAREAAGSAPETNLSSVNLAEVSAAQSAAPANLTELSYDELARQLRAREDECDKSFGRNDGKINEQQRSCYSKHKIKYTDACYEKDENAKRDCANSANLKQCLEIKHPEAATNIFISGCMAL